MITATKPPKSDIPKQTREGWLLKATAALRPLFMEKSGVHVPEDVEVSTGFPSSKGISAKTKTIGQCWTRACSEANVNQIFINPCLDDSVEVLAILIHELIHASDDCKSGHRGHFAKTAKSIGLEGKMTATHAGDKLKEQLQKIVHNIGKFPHKKLNASIDHKKQGTRLIKIGCDCGVIGRMSATAISEMTWKCVLCDQSIGEI